MKAWTYGSRFAQNMFLVWNHLDLASIVFAESLDAGDNLAEI